MKSLLEKNLRFSDCAKDLPSIVSKLLSTLHGKGYEINVVQLPNGGQSLKVEKGELLDELIGTKAKVCIDIIPHGSDLNVYLKAKLLKRQLVPTLIMLSYWPVLIAQIYGIYQQSELDKLIIATIKEFAHNTAPVEDAQVLEYF